MIVKYKLTNPERNPSFPYDRVYKLRGVTGIYTDYKTERWIVMRGKEKHGFPKSMIILQSIEREEDE